jgi:hypothetical protein
MTRLTLVALWCILGLTACSSGGNSGSRDLDSSADDPAELVVRNETVTRERFGRDMRRLLLAGKYDSLDHIARHLRTERIRWPNGFRKLRTFYVLGFDGPDQETSETQWREMIGHLNQWVGSTGSVTAHVALAMGLTGYAWHARGSGYASEVTDAGDQLFRRRLAEAEAVLVAAAGLPERCPGVAAAMLRVALGQGWERTRYDSLFARATADEPSYEAYYASKATRLLPRWHGEVGEWERFAGEAADRLGAKDGDAMYARIVWYLAEYYDNVFDETAASWERTARGYEHLVRTYPHSLELQSQFALLAAQARDRGRARVMFDRMGSRVDGEIWRTRERFIAIREWAMQ